MCLALGQMGLIHSRRISKPHGPLFSRPTHVGDAIMKRPALLAFAFAWLAACETPPSAPTSQTPLIPPPSFATTIANEKVSVANTFQDNPCPPEEVVDIFDGYLHFLVTAEIGETSADVTLHLNGEGIEGVGRLT